MKPRKLTDAQEDDLLDKVNLRKTLGSKALCAKYDIGRRTLLDALRRARARRNLKEPKDGRTAQPTP